MQLETDILVIGSGIAGLTLALKASEYARVLIITKKDRAESNTNYAQGGIASVVSKNDSFISHINDTLECGAGLCHIEAVKQIVNNGPHLIDDLMKFGVNFSREGGKLDLGREGGHSANRIIHSKDKTGREIERALLYKISRNREITLLEHHTAVELITEHHFKKAKTSNKNCYGAYVYDEKRDIVKTVSSLITVICSGGIGQVYLHTTNPSIATGDGIAMAYRCGCEIANMEFVQFHPTSLYEPGSGSITSHSFLISEAMRGAGAKLRTIKGKEFMRKYDKRSELAPRDIVARAIDSEMKKSGSNHVYLDTSHIGKSKLTRKFPNIFRKCKEIGLDISKDYIPVVPAAHYICGGVASDLNGKTSLNRLYVLGEASMTGVHGANRLASNSLLEAVVYADKASKMCRKEINKLKNVKMTGIPLWDDSGTINTEEWVLVSQNRNEIRQVMSNYVGIVRNNERLKRALRRIELIRREIEDFFKRTRVNRDILELRNMALISYLITRSAILRKESRGLHYNTNYPYKSKRYNNDTVISIN
jgi:L-aspartate oxidase